MGESEFDNLTGDQAFAWAGWIALVADCRIKSGCSPTLNRLIKHRNRCTVELTLKHQMELDLLFKPSPFP